VLGTEFEKYFLLNACHYCELFVLSLLNNIRALNKLSIIIFLLVSLGMSSCVSRVSITEEEKPALVIDLQMLSGSDSVIYATVHTSNNLNGTYLIEKPDNIVITVKDITSDNFSNFIYNTETKVYDYFENEDILKSGKNLRLEAEIKGSNIPKITAFSKVPNVGSLVDMELMSNSIYKDPEGLEFWQGIVKFNFKNLNTNASLFYQLKLREKLQIKSIENGEDVVYTSISPDETPFTILNVTAGQFAVKEFINEDGLWIDLDKMDDDFFEIELRSNLPIVLEGQTSDIIFSQLFSITEDHYNYYLGLNNIETSSNSLFGEQGLYRTNIEKGFGIFSTCVVLNQEINLAQ
jgi:hypothetical protein